MKKAELYNFKSITVIQTAFLGDVALSMPLIANIRAINPKAHINFVTTPAGANIASVYPEIDNIIAYDKRNKHKGWAGIKLLAEKIKSFDTDCLIVPHRSLRSTVLSKMIKVKYSVSFDKSAFSILHKKRVKYEIARHEIERNLSLLEAFKDTKLSDLDPSLNLNYAYHEDDVLKVEEVLKTKGVNDFVVIAPASVWETKRWPKESFKELIKKLSASFKVVVIGGKEDVDLAEFVCGDSNAVNLAGQTSLQQTIYLMSKARLAITNDSAPTHFAGMVGIPTITIFGATSTEFGFYPRGKKVLSIQNEKLDCRPCAIHGGKKCPLKHFECMKSITPEYVYSKALEFLNN